MSRASSPQVPVPIEASNVQIVKLKLDKDRKALLERKKVRQDLAQQRITPHRSSRGSARHPRTRPPLITGTGIPRATTHALGWSPDSGRSSTVFHVRNFPASSPSKAALFHMSDSDGRPSLFPQAGRKGGADKGKGKFSEKDVAMADVD